MAVQGARRGSVRPARRLPRGSSRAQAQRATGPGGATRLSHLRGPARPDCQRRPGTQGRLGQQCVAAGQCGDEKPHPRRRQRRGQPRREDGEHGTGSDRHLEPHWPRKSPSRSSDPRPRQAGMAVQSPQHVVEGPRPSPGDDRAASVRESREASAPARAGASATPAREALGRRQPRRPVARPVAGCRGPGSARRGWSARRPRCPRGRRAAATAAPPSSPSGASSRSRVS